GETAGTKMKASNERPFDIWLQKQLHAMYDEIASEPLPNDLLGLIERDAEKKGKPPGSSGKKERKKNGGCLAACRHSHLRATGQPGRRAANSSWTQRSKLAEPRG